MRYLWKNLIAIAIIAPISFGAVYFGLPLLQQPEVSSEYQKTPTQKFITNLQNNFEIGEARVAITKYQETSVIDSYLDKAKIKFTTNDKLDLTFGGNVLLSGSVEGNLTANFNNNPLLDLAFTFTDNKAFLNFKEKYTENDVSKDYSKLLKINVNNILDIMNYIPVQMPSLGDSFDMSSLGSMITNIKDESEKYGNSQNPYAFTLPLNFDGLYDRSGNTISLIFFGDENFEPSAIRLTSNLALYGYEVSLEVDKMGIYNGEGISAPSNSNNYQSLDGVVDLAKLTPNLMEIFNKKKSNVDFDLSLSLPKGISTKLNGAISFDVNDNSYGINTTVIDGATNKSFGLKALFEGNTTYIDYASGALLGKIETSTAEEMFKKVNDLVEKYTKKNVITTITELIDDFKNSDKIDEVITHISSIDSIRKLDELIDIVTLPGVTTITFNSDIIGYEFGSIKLTVNTSSDNQVLESIELNGFEYGSYSLGLKLSLSDFTLPQIDKVNASSLAPISSLLDIIPELVDQKQYAIDANMNIEGAKNMTLNSKIQFDTTAQEYYGELIFDDSTFKHYLKFDGERDLSLEDSVCYAYYDNAERLTDDYSTSVKLKLGDIDDVFETIQTFRNNMYNQNNITSIGSYLTDILNNPAILQSVYAALFNISGNNLNITIDQLPEADVNGATKLINVNIDSSLLGLNEGKINLKIGFNDTKLLYLSVLGTDIPDLGKLDLLIKLVDYNEELAIKPGGENSSSTSLRLDKTKTYYNMGDIKLLVSLGCNTGLLKNTKYWVIDSSLKLKIVVYPITIPFQVYIKNNNGAVEILVNIPDLPITIVNQDTYTLDGNDYKPTSRAVQWYYKDGMAYINRVDQAKNNGWFNYEKIEYHLIRKFDIGKLLSRTTADDGLTPVSSNDNMIKLLSYVVEDTAGLGTVLGNSIPDLIYKSIRKSIENTAVMKYEQLLLDMQTGNNDNGDFISIRLNFSELAKNTDMTELKITIYYDAKSKLLKSAVVNMTATPAAGINIYIDFNMSLDLNADASNSETLFNNMYSFIETYKNYDPLADSPILIYKVVK